MLALDELADAIDGAIAGLAGRDALTALAETHRAYARERPGRYDAAGALDRPATDDLARAAGRHAAQQQAILRGYALGADAQVHATRLFASMLRGFIQLEAAGAFAHREPRSRRRGRSCSTSSTPLSARMLADPASRVDTRLTDGHDPARGSVSSQPDVLATAEVGVIATPALNRTPFLAP